jgi:hypothetical protein
MVAPLPIQEVAMSSSEPGPAAAADYLAADAAMGAAVRAGTQRYAGWLLAFAALTVMYLTALGLHTDDGPVGWLTAAYLLCTAGLTVSFLSGVRLAALGFERRFGRALGAWGALFAVVLVVGLLVFRGEPTFWFPAAVVTAVPLVLGARAELRA